MTAPAKAARRAGLVYVTDDQPGLRRVRRGRGFSYHHPDDSLVSDGERARIEALAIPPAWTDVWICADPDGHLQATGRDDKGRKQYRYHPDWQEHRNRVKFDRMVPFGEALPEIRARVDTDLRMRTLGREKVVALAVRLLDETLVRIGNPEYADQNDSYGLTTLRDKHVSFDGSEVRFSFVGKSGKEHELSVRGRRLARLVKACRDIPGYTLFQYYTDEGKSAIGSSDVNAYLRETMGDDFTAKDFRTWGGTVLAAKALHIYGAAEDEATGEQAIAETIKEVAEGLGNTVAVCRQYYVHPDILDAYRDGMLLDHLKRRHAGNTPTGLEPAEAAVLGVLRRWA
ncbi:MAG: DNA topoisomerase IB [Rhodothermaceae bacterium]|nr:DNA topoisomerase IB [Rhodothermaceae bacterium]